jgi:hypothetical protein
MSSESVSFIGRTLKSLHTVGVALIFSFADGTYAFLRPSEYHGRNTLIAMFMNESISPTVVNRMRDVELPEDARAALGRVILTVEGKATGMEFSFDEGYKLFVSPTEGIQFTKDGKVLGAKVN